MMETPAERSQPRIRMCPHNNLLRAPTEASVAERHLRGRVCVPVHPGRNEQMVQGTNNSCNSLTGCVARQYRPCSDDMRARRGCLLGCGCLRASA